MEDIDLPLNESKPPYEPGSYGDHLAQSEYYTNLAKRDVREIVVGSAIAGISAAFTAVAGYEFVQVETIDLGYLLGAVGGAALVGITIDTTRDSIDELFTNLKEASRHERAALLTGTPEDK